MPGTYVTALPLRFRTVLDSRPLRSLNDISSISYLRHPFFEKYKRCLKKTH